MPPKRDIYVNIVDPVEKQDINMNNKNNNNNKFSCKGCLVTTFLLCIIGFCGGFLYYNDYLNLNI
jgi:hypothetical protein